MYYLTITADILKELDGAFERALLTAVNNDKRYDETVHNFILKAFENNAFRNAIDELIIKGINDGQAYKKSLEALAIRTMYRHENNMGTVIEFNFFGVDKKLFVADQKYRFEPKSNSIRFNAAGLDTSHAVDITQDVNLNGFEYKKHPYSKTGDSDWAQDFYKRLDDDWNKDLTYNRDDNWIQTTYPSLGNDGSAQQNTDNLVSIGLEPVEQVREITIGDLGPMDIPNLFEAIIIYLEYDKLYSMDPTVTEEKKRPSIMTSSVVVTNSAYYGRRPRPVELRCGGRFDEIDDDGFNFIHTEFIPVKEID